MTKEERKQLSLKIDLLFVLQKEKNRIYHSGYTPAIEEILKLIEKHGYVNKKEIEKRIDEFLENNCSDDYGVNLGWGMMADELKKMLNEK